MGEERIKILIVEDNEKELEAFEKAVEEFPLIDIVFMTGRQSEAQEYISKEPVDVVIIDLELEEGDGVSFLEVLKEELFITPFVVVTTNNESIIISNRVRDGGADFIFKKSNLMYSAEYVLGFIMKTSKYFESVQIQKERILREEHMREQMEKIYRLETERALRSIGIGSNYKGVHYIKDAVSFVIRSKGVEKIQMKSIYYGIAEKYQDDYKNVERNMRTCIERAWSIQPPEVLERFYEGETRPDKGKPTNSEFIFYLAERVEKATYFDRFVDRSGR